MFIRSASLVLSFIIGTSNYERGEGRARGLHLAPSRTARGDGEPIRSVALFLEPSLLLLQGSDAVAELIERPGDVAILGVTTIAPVIVEVQALGALTLQQRQLDVVGEQEELVRIRHGGRYTWGMHAVAVRVRAVDLRVMVMSG